MTPRILLIAWLGWQIIMLPGGVTVAASREPVQSCCCCGAATGCKCGCSSTKRPPAASKTAPSMKRCDCGDQAAVVVHAHRYEPPAPLAAVLSIEDDVSMHQAFGSMLPARLRGPPPDLVVVQSTILLV